MFTLVDQGNASVNGMTLSPGLLPMSACPAPTPTHLHQSDVNKAGGGPGRACKIHATSYSTFNGLTCENSDPVARVT